MNKKEYRWRRSFLYSGILFGTFWGLIAYGNVRLAVLGKRINWYYVIFFLVLSVFSFLNYIFRQTKGYYIQITDDGIYISPSYFLRRTKDINWEAISKIKKIFKRNRAITLSRWYEKDITIYLGSLKKDDRDNLIQNIKAKVENKIDVEEK